MTLTPEQQASISQWNSEIGLEATEGSLRFFLNDWFANIRTLMKSSFRLHSIEELTTKLGKDYQSFMVLGSGPSLPSILKGLPPSPGAIFCGPTALGCLTREGFRPTVLVIADSGADHYSHLKESRISHPEALDVVLPVTANPQWYDNDSILNHSRLYFYLPYLDIFGDTDIGFNHILKQLFPKVAKYITQAGSVANLMLHIAHMCIEDRSADSRIYIGVDNSWVKGGPTRAPLRFDPPSHSTLLQAFWNLAHKPRTDLAEVPYGNDTIVTDLVSLGYAINLFYIIHLWERDNNSPCHRLIDNSSKLYKALASHVLMPLVTSEGVGLAGTTMESDEAWAYKVLIALVELSNRLLARLKAENIALTEEANAKIQASNALVATLGEGSSGNDRGKL